MFDKANKRAIKLISFILFSVCIVSLYFYLTRPVSLYDIIGKGTIKEIDISSSITETINYSLPSELHLRLDTKQDIDTFMDILNKYRYSKILKFYNSRVVPANPTKGIIDMHIFYSNNNNKLQYIYVDAENDVIIRNKNDVNIDYKIKGNDIKLFDDLSHWLSDNWPNKKEF